MELHGNKITFDPGKWPFAGFARTDAIQQAVHIPICATQFNSMFRTLSDYDKNSYEAAANVMVVQFFAEAVKNMWRYRGSQHGRRFFGKEPRVVVLLTYITRDLWENEQERSGLWTMKTLLEEENIVGLLYSILILDDDLNFSDAVSDQLQINVYGPPRHKKQFVQANANAEDDDDAAMPVDDTRLDVAGARLNHPESKYYFPTTHEGTSTVDYRVRYSKSPSNMYRTIASLQHYIRLVCNYIADIPGSVEGMESDDFSVCNLPVDSVFRPENTFSLDNALAKLQAWGANSVFCEKAYWINRDRPDSDGNETFGAPYWKGGLTATGDEYPAGFAQCSASIPLAKFTSPDLVADCLPHTNILDMSILRPRGRTKRTMVNTGAGEICLQDFMSSMGFQTVAEQIRQKKASDISLDIFNEYFSQMTPIAGGIDDLLTDIDTPSAEYSEKLKMLRQQGFAWYFSVMDPTNPNLPDSYKALVLYTWERESWIPEHETMWQTADVAMSPFAQHRVRDMVFDESLVNISDNTLVLKPRMIRALYTAVLPRDGSEQHKEHMQFVGTPGTSKSYTINAVIALLIPETYETKSGGSNMGMLGPMRSRRMVIVYHELPNLYAPDGDYRGDTDKHLRMTLTQLSEGITEYSTTREVTLENGSKTRENVGSRSDYTNVVIGARNHKNVKTSSGSAVEAMYDRFTIVEQRQILAKGRVNLINRVLDANRRDTNGAYEKLKDHNHYMHRAIMEYGALISCYAVPMPDLSLFTALAPLAMGYLAQLRPELHFQLRNIRRIRTRMQMEVIMYGARMALCSPLSPTAEKEYTDDGSVRLNFGEYRTETAAKEMSKYMYATMDQLVYVLTEAMYELTSAESFAITNSFAKKFANYYSLGQLQCDHKPPGQRHTWSNSQEAHMAEIGELVPGRGSVLEFVAKISAVGNYYLGMPINIYRTRMKTASGDLKRSAHYTEYDLQEVHIEAEYEELFMLNAPKNGPAFKLERNSSPRYKQEHIGNTMFINPNYITIKNDIQNFAKLVRGQIGHFNLDEAAIKDLLYDLCKKQIVTHYMPVLDSNLAIVKDSMHDIQSLRYIREAMTTFPKYKVPVLIVDPHEGEFHILISYFETNPYEVVNNMVSHICYHATMRRRTIMGIPSQNHCLHYEPVDINPIPNKRLVLPRRTNINKQTLSLVKQFCGPEMQEIACGDEVYTTKDMEQLFALNYLKRNNPDADHATLKKYTPRGIWRQFYGPNGFYRVNPENLRSVQYPEVFLQMPVVDDDEEEEEIPFQQPVVVASNKRREQARADAQASRALKAHKSSDAQVWTLDNSEIIFM